MLKKFCKLFLVETIFLCNVFTAHAGFEGPIFGFGIPSWKIENPALCALVSTVAYLALLPFSYSLALAPIAFRIGHEVYCSRIGYTPLHRATEQSLAASTKRLIECGCDVNQRTIEKDIWTGTYTPIDLAYHKYYNYPYSANNDAELNTLLEFIKVAPQDQLSDWLGRSALQISHFEIIKSY